MKKLIFTIATSILTIGCFAQVNPNSTYVNGYYRTNGTYVEGHNKTVSNNTNSDNYSTKPNTNPYTGKKGYIQSDNNYSEPKSSTGSYNAYSSCGNNRRRK
jgi:hypothetical protein